MRAAIELAVRDTNQRTRCKASPAKAKRQFIQTFYRLAASEATVPERGGLRALGFEAISAFLEHEADTIAFGAGESVYGDVTFGQSAVLSVAGIASTIELSGHRIGTDKIDHFIHFGYLQWQKSKQGADPARGKRWGVHTERTFFGLYTSKAFSFADLAANEAGTRFYASLFEDGGPVAYVDGCIEQTDAPFDWREWVTADWDEALNPSVYSGPVGEKIRLRIAKDRDHYCQVYVDVLGGEAYDAMLAERFAGVPSYADAPRVPVRTDPFELAKACADADR